MLLLHNALRGRAHASAILALAIRSVEVQFSYHHTQDGRGRTCHRDLFRTTLKCDNVEIMLELLMNLDENYAENMKRKM